MHRFFPPRKQSKDTSTQHSHILKRRDASKEESNNIRFSDTRHKMGTRGQG